MNEIPTAAAIVFRVGGGFPTRMMESKTLIRAAHITAGMESADIQTDTAVWNVRTLEPRYGAIITAAIRVTASQTKASAATASSHQNRAIHQRYPSLSTVLKIATEWHAIEATLMLCDHGATDIIANQDF